MSNSLAGAVVDGLVEYVSDPSYYDINRCDRDYVGLMMGYGAYVEARNFLVKNYHLTCESAKEIMTKIKARIISGMEV